MKYSKIIVALVIVIIAAYTAAVLLIYNKIGTEPSILTTAIFAFATGELWNLAGIKKKEIDTKKKEGEQDGH